MGFLSTVGKAIGKVAQGASDTVVDGPMGPVMRAHLESLQRDINKRIQQYQQINGQVGQWRDLVDQTGDYTSAMLHQTSDFVHGLAVNYEAIVNNASIDMPNIRNLANSNVLKPIVDLPIPGSFGGVPSALMPGIETVKIVEGLVNLVGGSVTLPHEVKKAQENLAKANHYVRREQRVLNDLVEVKTYLLGIANDLTPVFQRTTGLALPHFRANSPAELRHVVAEMKSTIRRITAVKGNAFMVSRFILNVIKTKKITAVNDAQVKFIADNLFAIDSIHNGFESEANLETFVRNFFGGLAVAPAILLHLPEPPPDIKPYITETEPAHQSFTDPNSSQFDPPDIDLSHFPS